MILQCLLMLCSQRWSEIGDVFFCWPFCPHFWAAVVNVDLLSPMLTPRLLCRLLASNVDSLSSFLAPCLQCWLFVPIFDSLSQVLTPVFLIDSCFQYQPLTFHVDSLATMLTHCFSLWLLVSLLTQYLPFRLLVFSVDPLSSVLTLCLQYWPFSFHVDSLF